MPGPAQRPAICGRQVRRTWMRENGPDAQASKGDPGGPRGSAGPSPPDFCLAGLRDRIADAWTRYQAADSGAVVRALPDLIAEASLASVSGEAGERAAGHAALAKVLQLATHPAIRTDSIDLALASVAPGTGRKGARPGRRTANAPHRLEAPGTQRDPPLRRRVRTSMQLPCLIGSTPSRTAGERDAQRQVGATRQQVTIGDPSEGPPHFLQSAADP